MQSPSDSRIHRILESLKTLLGVVWFVPCLILLSGAMLTGLGWKMAQQQNQLRRHGVFNAQLVRLVSRIEEHFRANEQMLRGVAGLFASSDDVSREEFRTYFQNLDLDSNYPGIQGIGFSQLIRPEQLEAHIQEVRKQGFPSYRVFPAGSRDLYTAIVFLEPFNRRNRRAFGFDMFAEPTRREAMIRARDTGKAALSGKVHLMQDADQLGREGTLLFLPVYKEDCFSGKEEDACTKSLMGWAYSPMRIKDFIEGVFQKEFNAGKGIGLEIYDGKSSEPRSLLYRSDDYSNEREFETTQVLSIAGEPWTLHAHSNGALPLTNADDRGPKILLFGFSFSGLLALLALAFLRDHKKLSISLKETAEAHRLLKQSQLELQAIYDTSGVAILLVDRNGVITYANQYMAEMFAMSHEELVGSSYLSLVPEQYRTSVSERIHSLAEGKDSGLVVERAYLRKDGSEFWGHLSARRLLDAEGKTRGLVGVIIDITERQHAEDRLRQSEARYRSLTEAMQDVVWILDVETMCFTYCSPSIKQLRGYSSEEMVGAHLSEVYMPETGNYLVNLIRTRALALERGQEGVEHYYVDEIDLPRRDGGIVSTEIVSVFSFDPESGNLVLRGVTRNITERKRHEEERRIAAVAFESRESMVVTDAAGIVIRVNQAFIEQTGYEVGEVLGKTLRILHSGRHDQDFYVEMWETILRDGFWQGEVWNRRKDGQIYPEWLSITAVRNEAGRTTHYIGASFDITRRVESESEIRNLAFYDPLTGLPNRRLFADRLGQAFAKSSRSHKFGAVLYVDLDRFKEVNDRLGHAEGDRLLEIVADRLATNVREGDTVSRFGGDEFVILLEDVDADRDAALELTLGIAEKLRAALNMPYKLHGAMPADWHCSPSIGVAVFRGLQEDMESVLIRADRAMYSAKDSGRNTVCVARNNNGNQ